MENAARTLLVALALIGALPTSAAAEPARPGGILIKLRPDATAQDAQTIYAAVGGQIVRSFGFIGVEHVVVPEGQTESALTRLRADPRVEYAEPNLPITLDRTPDDPRFPEQYALDNHGQTGGTPGAHIGALAAWDLFTGDPELKIGVIDTGVDYTHPDLAANAWINPGEIAGNRRDDDGNGYIDDVHGYDFWNDDGDPMDDHGHGTHCAGILAAVGDNGVGIAGVCWRARIVAIKFVSDQGVGSTAGALAGIEYAIAVGARLTSNSWGGYGFSQALHDAVAAAGAAGQLFVAAAGNNGLDSDRYPHYPAAFDLPHVIAVAATDHDDRLAPTSNFGATSVDLAAPGTSVLSTIPGAGYMLLSGTSMATPHVAGAVALLLGHLPQIGGVTGKRLLLGGADRVPGLEARMVSGGRLNAHRPLADPDITPPGRVVDLAVVDPGSTRLTLAWSAPGDDGVAGTAARYEIRYSQLPLDEGNFARGRLVEAPPPAPAGAVQRLEVGGLVIASTYHFALRAWDDYDNPSPLSNLATGTTLGPPRLDAAPQAYDVTVSPGETLTRALAVRNDGEGVLDFAVPPPEILLRDLPRPQDSSLPVPTGRGGPDPFGYRWMDSDQPGGPSFDWVDITGVGTHLDLFSDDEMSRRIPMGMAFPFYGRTYTSVFVCTNGYLSFTDDEFARFDDQPLPSARAPAALVAPFWDDLHFQGFRCAWVHGDGSRFVVSWVRVPHIRIGERRTFQTVLYPNGEIRFQYLELIPRADAGVTIGIQNAGRDTGLTVVHDAPYLHDGLAIRVVPLPNWITVEPAAGRLPAGHSAELAVRFDPTGLAGGHYQALVHVESNDPLHPVVTLPVAMHVPGVPRIAARPETLALGEVRIGNAVTRELRIWNLGSDDLEVAAVTSTRADVIVGPAGFVLPPLTQKAVEVRFAPESPCDPCEGALVVSSSDPARLQLEIPMTAVARTPPRLAAAAESLAVALAPALAPRATVASKTLRLWNRGGSPLTLTAQAEDALAAWLGVEPAVGTIAPGDSLDLVVRFDAEGLGDGDHEGEVVVSSDDPLAPTLRLPCRLHVGLLELRLDVKPERLRAEREGRMHARLHLPAGVHPRALVPGSVRLQRVLAPLEAEDEDEDDDESETVSVAGSLRGRENEKERPRSRSVHFRFDRAALIALLPASAKAEVELSGELDGMSWFAGVDTVQVIARAREGTLEGDVLSSHRALPARDGLRLLERNPARSAARLELALAAPAAVRVRIYDVSGALVSELARGRFDAGIHAVTWDGRTATGAGAPSGIYFVRLEGARERVTLRLVMAR